ncbi:MAG: hypothetical protein AAF962_10050 [Actinomycetota bacterium]
MTGRRSSPTALGGAVTALAALGLTACGAPTHQIIQPEPATFTYELPIEFVELGEPDAAGTSYGLPGAAADTLAGEPVVLTATSPDGGSQSYRSLRELATGGQFDPLNPDPALVDTAASQTTLINYAEISEPDVWGLRMQLTIGDLVIDYQALVDRRTDNVVLTEVYCTLACFTDQVDLIDDIQTSWQLES